MPKGRYRLMTDYMPTRGTRGLEMMYLTATVQVNLDFGSPADMVEKLKIALALQPWRRPCSPIRRSKWWPTGNLSERSSSGSTRTPTAPACCPWCLNRGSALNTMSITRSMRRCILCSAMGVINALGMSFRDFLEGRLPACPVRSRPRPIGKTI